MTEQEALEILHPDTTRVKIAEIEYYAGFNETKALEAVNEACLIACKALEKQIAKKPNRMQLKDGIITTLYECPICGCRRLGHGFDLDKCYCPECGQKLDWSEV